MHQDHLHIGFDTTVGDVAAFSSASPSTGVVETVAAKPPAAKAPAPTEPRFDAGGAGASGAGAEPRFEVDG